MRCVRAHRAARPDALSRNVLIADLSGMRRLSKFEAAEDRHEQIVEVMRNAAGELADRFHLLRLEKASRVRSSSSSAFLRSVMSRVILANPTSSPSCRGSRRSPHWPRTRFRPCGHASLPFRTALRARPSRARCRHPRLAVLVGIKGEKCRADDLSGCSP